ncbi:MAG: TIGR03936 family radical SAM-associated protein [Vicinamibacteria bacterium]
MADTTQRDVEAMWVAAIGETSLPVTRGDDGRPKVAFGAPLPVGIAADGEYLDLILTERWPVWRVRDALEPVLPDGWTLRDLVDVWLGAPTLAAAVAGADYRITLGGTAGATAIATAAASMLTEATLPRTRAKGTGTVAYDLRPLLVRLAVVDAGPSTVVMARTRFHQTLGSGRPDEVVAALAERVDGTLDVATVVRERLLLTTEVDAGD